MEIKKYLKQISDTKDENKLHELDNMFADLMYYIREVNMPMYCEYKMCLYELLNGQKLTEEKAGEWIRSMRPYGMKWSLEQTEEVRKDKKIEVDRIDFWAMMNAMYNDYYNIFQDNVETYVQLTTDFINDEDAEPNKTYLYWKNIAKK